MGVVVSMQSSFRAGESNGSATKVLKYSTRKSSVSCCLGASHGFFSAFVSGQTLKCTKARAWQAFSCLDPGKKKLLIWKLLILKRGGSVEFDFFFLQLGIREAHFAKLYNLGALRFALSLSPRSSHRSLCRRASG